MDASTDSENHHHPYRGQSRQRDEKNNDRYHHHANKRRKNDEEALPRDPYYCYRRPRNEKGRDNFLITKQPRTKAGGDQRRKQDGGPLKLWVGRLPHRIREQDILQTFARFGPIQRVKTVYKPDHFKTSCAFVTFQNASDARRAKDALDGSVTFPGSPCGPIRVEVSNDEMGGRNMAYKEEDEQSYERGQSTVLEPNEISSRNQQKWWDSPKENNGAATTTPLPLLRRYKHEDSSSLSSSSSSSSSSLLTRRPKNDDSAPPHRDIQARPNHHHYPSSSSRSSETKNEQPLRLYVSRLPKGITKEDLLPAFQAFGPIQKVYVMNSSDRRRRWDHCFVTYRYAMDAKMAQKDLHGSDTVLGATHGPIFVTVANQERKGENGGCEESSHSSIAKSPRGSSREDCSYNHNEELSPSTRKNRGGLQWVDTEQQATSSWNHVPADSKISSKAALVQLRHASSLIAVHNTVSQQNSDIPNNGDQNLGKDISLPMKDNPGRIQNGQDDELTMLSNLSKKLQHNKELETVNDDLKRELSQEKHRNEAAAAILKDFEKEVVRLKTQNQSFERENEALQMQVQQLKEEKKALHQQSQMAHEEFKREASQVEELKHQLQELRQAQALQITNLRAKVEEAVRHAFEEGSQPVKQESTK